MNKYQWNLEKIKNAVKESINLSEVLIKLNIPRQGNNSATLKKILDSNNIDYSHFTGRARTYKTTYVKAEVYLNSDKQINTSKLKSKLLKETILENRCAVCGIQQWNNKPIVLQLHHIDGNPSNNSLNNLQLLCPNCHSQTENYCGNANKNIVKYYCKDCGKEITKGSTYCSMCASKHRRKVERPTKNQLINDFVKHKSFVQVAKIYNISDNALRKWCISYNLPTKTKEMLKYTELNIVGE